MGSASPPTVGPASYKEMPLPKKIKGGKLQGAKTHRLEKPKQSGPSPHDYDTVTGLSMCSSQSQFRTLKKDRSQSSIGSSVQQQPEGRKFSLAPHIKGGMFIKSERNFELM